MRLLLPAVIATLAVGVAGTARARQTPCQEYFSDVSGIWSCGYGTAGTSFTAFSMKQHHVLSVGRFNIWVSPDPATGYVGRYKGLPMITNTTALIYPTIVWAPGPGADTIILWTAKTGGIYRFKGSYTCLDESPTGIQALIFHNGINMTTAAFAGGTGYLLGAGANLSTLTPGAAERFSFTVNVAAGDVITFGLNNAGDYRNDTTGFEVVVTKPQP